MNILQLIDAYPKMVQQEVRCCEVYCDTRDSSDYDQPVSGEIPVGLCISEEDPRDPRFSSVYYLTAVNTHCPCLTQSRDDG